MQTIINYKQHSPSLHYNRADRLFLCGIFCISWVSGYVILVVWSSEFGTIYIANSIDNIFYNSVFERIMMTETIYPLTLLDLQAHANHVATEVVSSLEKDGKLTCSADEILESHAVVAYRKGVFGRFLAKFLYSKGDEDGSIRYLFVKL